MEGYARASEHLPHGSVLTPAGTVAYNSPPSPLHGHCISHGSCQMLFWDGQGREEEGPTSGLTKLAVCHFGPGLDGGDGGDNGAVRHDGAVHLNLLGGRDAAAWPRCRMKLWWLLVEQLRSAKGKTPIRHPPQPSAGAAPLCSHRAWPCCRQHFSSSSGTGGAGGGEGRGAAALPPSCCFSGIRLSLKGESQQPSTNTRKEGKGMKPCIWTSPPIWHQGTVPGGISAQTSSPPPHLTSTISAAAGGSLLPALGFSWNCCWPRGSWEGEFSGTVANPKRVSARGNQPWEHTTGPRTCLSHTTMTCATPPNISA